ncbi:MAG: diguanylate cyclase domain-containing protein [Limnospira sp.]
MSLIFSGNCRGENSILKLTDEPSHLIYLGASISENDMMNESNPTTQNGADILVIDSQLDDIQFLSKLLLDAGYKVRKSLSIKMAMSAIKMTAPDLILLSVSWSDMHRHTLLNDLDILRQNYDIPVILLGTLDCIVETGDIFPDRHLDYIIKPFRPAEILVRVANQLKLSRVYREMTGINCQFRHPVRDRQKAEQVADRIRRQLNSSHREIPDSCQFDFPIREEYRREFDEALNREWRRGAREKMPLSLILCEIDSFQAYNHLYGYDSVSWCLEQIARAIDRQAKRPADRVLYCGQSEFAVILPNTNHRGAVEVAKAIRGQVHQLGIPHERGIDRKVTLSLGIASTIPQFDLLPDTIVAIAEEAVGEARHQGGDRIGCQVNWR